MSKHSPITYRRHRTRSRSRSRDRNFRRKSPLPGRNRLPIHVRLNDKRSIERRLNYPSKYELFNNERNRSFRKSKSPIFSSSRLSRRRSRSRSSNRRSRRHSSSSRSPRRSRQYSRSTSRSRERSKFTYSSDYNLSELIDKQNDELIRNLNYQNEQHHLNSINLNAASSSNYLLDKPLDDKLPLFDKQPPLERTLYENEYYIDNNQLNDNQFKLNLYSNQNIPIRDRLDKTFDMYSSNALLETPNLNLPNQLNSINQLNTSAITNNNLNNLNNNNLNNNNLNNNNLNNNNLNNNNLNNNRLINNQDNNGNYFRNQDIDFRNSSNNLLGQQSNNTINQDVLEKCNFAHLGCPINLNKDTMISHLDECLYNPKNVKTFCNKCKLIVCPEHDCIQELRIELNSTKIKTSWSQNTIKLTNSSLLSDLNNEHQIISVHYSGEKEIMKKMKINKNDRVDFIIKSAVDLIFTKESLFRQNKTERDFQLIATGLYAFQPEISFNKSLKLQLPTLDDHLHLILIEKRITLKVFVKRLFYENQNIIVSVPKSIPFTIDPTKKISDLKQMIGEKLPINWSKHRLIINCKEYQDYQLLFSIGLINGEKVEVEADF